MRFSRTFLRLLFAVAVTGLCASLAIHIATFWGIASELKNPYIWRLHVFGLIILVLALLAGGGLAGTFRPRDYLRLAFRYTSAFHRRVAGALVTYAGITLFACLVLLDSGPAGYLFGRGGIADNIRAIEFRNEDMYALRLFTCGWIISYAVAAAILASAKNAPDHDRPQSTSADGSTPASARQQH
jgi:hypothetical protein